MDQFEALADGKDREIDALFILLTLHVVPNALRALIEESLITCLGINQACSSTSEEYTVDLVEQCLKVFIRQIPTNRHGPAASIVQEVRISFPSKVVILESACFHKLTKRRSRGKAPYRLIGLESSLEVQVCVILLKSFK